MGDRSRRNMRKAAPDPRKDKLAYFKDNIQTQDEEDFDPTIYYYRRPGTEKDHLPPSAGGHVASSATHLSRVPGDSRIQGDQHRFPNSYSPRIYGAHGGMVHPGVTAHHPGMAGMNSRNVHAVPGSIGGMGRFNSGTSGRGRNVNGAPQPGMRMAGMHKPMIPGSSGTASSVQMHPSGYSALSYGSGPMVHSSASSDGISLHDMTEFPTLNKGAASSDGIPSRTRRDMNSPKKYHPHDGRSGVVSSSDVPGGISMNGNFGGSSNPAMGSYGGMPGAAYEQVKRETSVGGGGARPAPRYTGAPAQPSGRGYMGGPIPQQSSSARGAQRGRHVRMAAPGSGGVGRGGYAMPQRIPKGRTTSSLPDKYGLMGLLSVIRMSDPDLNTLAVGTDLTTLGLNLNAPESLYVTFDSPFREGPSKLEPEHFIPSCYYLKDPVKPAEAKIGLFSLETLFYIFYSMPGDASQLAAAEQLNKQHWRFHRGLRMWFKPNKGARIERFSKPDGAYERGSYTFFDPSLWQRVTRDNFTLKVDW